ncbi:hypothetical protein [Guyparkeria sp.]
MADRHGRSATRSGNRAREQLDKRYANAEIDRETYERIKRDLDE